MRPSEPNQHLRQWTVVSAHAETVEQRCAQHRVAQQQRTHHGMSLIDDAFGQRMVIIADRANPPVREKEVLAFERVAATHDSSVDGDEKFVVDTGLRRTRQPARLRPAIEHQILVIERPSKALIELRHRGLVLGTIRLKDNGQEESVCALPALIIIVILSEAKDLLSPATGKKADPSFRSG